MNWKRIALACAILLTSCAEQVLKQHAEATIGQTMAQVAAVHGPPNSSFDLDHTHRTFQYIKLGNSLGFAAVLPGNPSLIVSAPPQATQCQVLLTTVAIIPSPTTLADWRVENYSIIGDCG